MTQAELESLCAKWQKRLRLQDWNVKVEVVRFFDIPEKLGEAEIHNQRKEAVIRIIGESDRREQRDTPVEHTLIHELLHLHFEPFWDQDKYTEMEQAINLITGALYDG